MEGDGKGGAKEKGDGENEERVVVEGSMRGAEERWDGGVGGQGRSRRRWRMW